MTDPKDAAILQAAEHIISSHPGLSTPAISRVIGCESSHLYRLLCTSRKVQELPDRGALTYWGPR